ncbi:tetratricopeptide repeat protein [Parafrankia sp. BMG5.11]|uniref:tetratricopeptide repeat protein n=1 Tax=Parafrankia sp. BMG5.11 TaxID=222540 RepID=UPI00103AD449|nr:tetratricopeptide repeat protein [Parafrankia sp. BMG5.11]TCJ38974.1 tetratricopeptide repeat protein [Parafrankia sp. BMG5.11]
MALTPDKSLAPDDKRARAAAAQNDVLLREVDDAVRQDQYADAARRYGRPALIAVVVVLALFAAYLFWNSRQEAARERDSEALVGALDQVERGNLASGATALDPLIADGTDGAKAAAQMLKAGIAMEQSKPDDAVKLYEAVAADGDAPQALRDLATIRGVTARYDRLAPADVIGRLKPLAVPGNAWFGPAGELVAMAYLDQGNTAEAGALFAAIAKDKGTSETLRSRIRQMAGLLGVDAIDDVDTVLNRPQGAGE